MRPYSTLTPRGKARRLRHLASNAVAAFPLQVADIRLLGLHTNTFFRLRTRDGTPYVLRLCQPDWRSETDLQSEVMWLNALAADPAIGAPQPVPACDGRYLVTASAPGVPEPRRCLLLTWLPGRPLANDLSESNLEGMGALFARLHAHAVAFQPPLGFTQRRMDGIYARGEADVLLTEPCRAAFTPRIRHNLTAARDRVEAVFADRYADLEGLRVIHNDLWHGNIIVHRGRLHPLDFEDTIWGFPVQDIAMALQDLMRDVHPERFDPLCAAFRRGYVALAPWPERETGEIHAFRVGRMIWVANYVARYQRPHLHEHLEWLTTPIERFLATGALRLA